MTQTEEFIASTDYNKGIFFNSLFFLEETLTTRLDIYFS